MYLIALVSLICVYTYYKEEGATLEGQIKDTHIAMAYNKTVRSSHTFQMIEQMEQEVSITDLVYELSKSVEMTPLRIVSMAEEEKNTHMHIEGFTLEFLKWFDLAQREFPKATLAVASIKRSDGLVHVDLVVSKRL